MGWLWYLGTLVPVIGFLQMQIGAHARADRYTYPTQASIAIVLAWLAAVYWPRRPWARLAGTAAVGRRYPQSDQLSVISDQIVGVIDASAGGTYKTFGCFDGNLDPIP